MRGDQADVADDSACRAMADASVREFGRLDILVNNAGATSFIPHADLDGVQDEDWDSARKLLVLANARPRTMIVSASEASPMVSVVLP